MQGRLFGRRRTEDHGSDASTVIASAFREVVPSSASSRCSSRGPSAAPESRKRQTEFRHAAGEAVTNRIAVSAECALPLKQRGPDEATRQHRRSRRHTKGSSRPSRARSVSHGSRRGSDSARTAHGSASMFSTVGDSGAIASSAIRATKATGPSATQDASHDVTSQGHSVGLGDGQVQSVATPVAIGQPMSTEQPFAPRRHAADKRSTKDDAHSKGEHAKRAAPTKRASAPASHSKLYGLPYSGSASNMAQLHQPGSRRSSSSSSRHHGAVAGQLPSHSVHRWAPTSQRHVQSAMSANRMVMMQMQQTFMMNNVMMASIMSRRHQMQMQPQVQMPAYQGELLQPGPAFNTGMQGFVGPPATGNAEMGSQVCRHRFQHGLQCTRHCLRHAHRDFICK